MASAELPRELGLLDSISIIIGIIIGASIFLVPNLIARSLPSSGWILSVWVFTGVLSFFGALAFAELGAMLPATGGQYVYLREAYGQLPAFLCGWTHFLISQTAGIAYLSVTFSLFFAYFVPLTPWQEKGVALAAMASLSLVNYRGVRFGATVQNACNLAKLAGLAVIVAAAFYAPRVPLSLTFGPVSAGAFGVAMIASLQAYDGWSAISFVAGEVKNPQRTLLRALTIGIVLSIAIYLLVNAAYLKVLTVPEIAGAARVGSLAAERSLGPFGAMLVAFTILLSTFGSLNGRILTQPRIYFAQACDGLFFEKFTTVHPRYKTPSFSILIQALWAAILILSGSYEILIDYRIFGVWMFYMITVAGVIALRRKRPDLQRPYRMWGYPYTAFIFIAVAFAFMVNTLIHRPIPSLAGLAIMAAGIPVYYLRRRSLR